MYIYTLCNVCIYTLYNVHIIMCIHAAEMNMQEFINEEGEDFSVEEQKARESICTVLKTPEQ